MAMNDQIYVMREAIIKLTQLLAGKGIQVTQRGISAYVRADKSGRPVLVNLPYIPDNATTELIDAIQGFLDHEVAHILFTEFGVMDEAMKVGSGGMLNLMEDARIEREMGNRFKGSAENLARMGKFFLDKYTKPRMEAAIKSGNKKELIAVLTVPLVRAMAGQQIFKEFMNDKMHHVEEVNEKIKDLAPRIASASSTRDCLELANTVVKRLRDGAKPPVAPPPKDEDDEDAVALPSTTGSKGKKKGAEKETKSGGKGKKDEEKKEDEEKDKEEGEKDEKAGKKEEKPAPAPADKKEGDDEESPAPSGDDDEDEEESPAPSDDKDEDEDPAPSDDEDDDDEDPAPSDDGDDDDDDDDDDDAAPAGPEDDDDDIKMGGGGNDDDDDDFEPEAGAASGADASEAELDVSKPSAMSWEEIDKEASRDYDESVSNLITNSAAESACTAEYLVFSKEKDVIEPLYVGKSYRPDMLERVENDVNHMVGPLQKDLERAISARSLSSWSPGHRSGRINASALSRLAVNDSRVFRRKSEVTSKDVAVELVVDMSGSMLGSKIATAVRAAYALASVLERIGIPCEVICFTTGRATPDDEDQMAKEVKRIGRKFSRSENLYMPILKDFKERMNAEVKRRFGWLPNCADLRNNIDGECVEIAARRLMARREAGKILMVLSDGAPSCFGDHKALQTHLKKVVENVSKAGVNVVGIGIESTEVRRFYPKNLVLNNVAELPVVVMKELRSLIVK